jgi:hypothetical protein
MVLALRFVLVLSCATAFFFSSTGEEYTSEAIVKKVHGLIQAGEHERGYEELDMWLKKHPKEHQPLYQVSGLQV